MTKLDLTSEQIKSRIKYRDHIPTKDRCINCDGYGYVVVYDIQYDPPVVKKTYSCDNCAGSGYKQEGRITNETGAIREELELAYHLIPSTALRRLAKLYAEGAVKYAPRNWEKGLPYSKTIDHLQEHIEKWKEGDTTEDHLARTAWGIFALMFYEKYCPMMDDIHVVRKGIDFGKNESQITSCNCTGACKTEEK